MKPHSVTGRIFFSACRTCRLICAIIWTSALLLSKRFAGWLLTRPPLFKANPSEDETWSILVQLERSSWCSLLRVKAVSPKGEECVESLHTSALWCLLLLLPLLPLYTHKLTDLFGWFFFKSCFSQYPSPSHSLEFGFGHFQMWVCFAQEQLPNL